MKKSHSSPLLTNADVAKRVLDSRIRDALKLQKNFKIVDLPIVQVKLSELKMRKTVYNDLNDLINKHKNEYVLLYEARWIPVGDVDEWENANEMPQKLYVRYYVPSDKKVWKAIEGSKNPLRRLWQWLKEIYYLREWGDIDVY